MGIVLDGDSSPVEANCSFDEWMKYHQDMEIKTYANRRRLRNRRFESRGKTIRDWSLPIFRVQDYIIAIGAFRFSFIYGCLETDVFMPIPQPHVAGKSDPVKVLLSESLVRGRDYCGSLKIMFTRDIRENEKGRLN